MVTWSQMVKFQKDYENFPSSEKNFWETQLFLKHFTKNKSVKPDTDNFCVYKCMWTSNAVHAWHILKTLSTLACLTWRWQAPAWQHKGMSQDSPHAPPPVIVARASALDDARPHGVCFLEKFHHSSSDTSIFPVCVLQISGRTYRRKPSPSGSIHSYLG